MFVSAYRVSVEWRDLDPADIVFYPNYFIWFDSATWWMFENAGFPRQTMIDRFKLSGMPILEAKSKFMSPSRFHDQLTIESRVVAWRGKVFEVVHRAMNNGVLAAEGSEIRAWCTPHPDDPKRMKASPVPPEIIDRFNKG